MDVRHITSKPYLVTLRGVSNNSISKKYENKILLSSKFLSVEVTMALCVHCKLIVSLWDWENYRESAVAFFSSVEEEEHIVDRKKMYKHYVLEIYGILGKIQACNHLAVRYWRHKHTSTGCFCYGLQGELNGLKRLLALKHLARRTNLP